MRSRYGPGSCMQLQVRRPYLHSWSRSAHGRDHPRHQHPRPEASCRCRAAACRAAARSSTSSIGETARIDALIAKVRDAIDRLKELRTALISAAVTGKIDVREEVA